MDYSPLTLFVVSESARREVLSRLLRLNHERYEEEIRNQRLGIQERRKRSR